MRDWLTASHGLLDASVLIDSCRRCVSHTRHEWLILNMIHDLNVCFVYLLFYYLVLLTFIPQASAGIYLVMALPDGETYKQIVFMHWLFQFSVQIIVCVEMHLHSLRSWKKYNALYIITNHWLDIIARFKLISYRWSSATWLPSTLKTNNVVTKLLPIISSEMIV